MNMNKDCKCSLRTRLVGDGCEACNPELAKEMNAPEQPKPSRRYTCELCGAKCRTGKRERGTRTTCPKCERLCGKLDGFGRWITPKLCGSGAERKHESNTTN